MTPYEITALIVLAIASVLVFSKYDNSKSNN